MGAIYYPLHTYYFSKSTSKFQQHMLHNMNALLTFQSQNAFRLVFLWLVEENLLSVLFKILNFVIVYWDISDYNMVECPSGKWFPFILLY